jgi:GntR family transcriptional regulator
MIGMSEQTVMLPLYETIRMDILDRILSGEWDNKVPLPPEGKLCEYYQASRMTVRRAVEELVRDGFLYKQRGKGTFVRRRSSLITGRGVGDFPDLAKPLEATPDMKILKFAWENPTTSLAKRLGITTDDSVLSINVLRFLDDEVVGWQMNCLRESAGRRIQRKHFEETQSIIKALQFARVDIVEAIGQLRARLAKEKECDLLECKLGDPVLESTVTSYSVEGVPINTSDMVFRSDRFHYHLHVVTDRL